MHPILIVLGRFSQMNVNLSECFFEYFMICNCLYVTQIVNCYQRTLSMEKIQIFMSLCFRRILLEFYDLDYRRQYVLRQ